MADPTATLAVTNPIPFRACFHIEALDDGGNTLTGWEVNYSLGGTSSTDFGDTICISDITPGTYTFTLSVTTGDETWFPDALILSVSDDGTITGTSGSGDCPTIQIGDLILGSNLIDGDGIYWTWTNIDGWDGPAPPRRSTIARQLGAQVTSSTRGARIVTLDGSALTLTPDLYYLARARVEGVAEALIDAPDLLIVNRTPAFQSTVWLNERTKTKRVGNLQGIEFTFVLRAPDPVKAAA